MRKVVAMAATPGLIAGCCIFIASFFGLTLDRLGPKVFLLHLGVFAIAIPLFIVDRQRNRADLFRGMPRWVVRSTQILFLLFIAVFFTFMVLTHMAAPQIINGEYVLNSHGKIVGYISEKDYLSLKGWELRLFASGWIAFYYALIMQWWFPRQDEWTVLMPDGR